LKSAVYFAAVSAHPQRGATDIVRRTQ